MTSSKNNHFTARDIERYYSGKMSVEERHALEKAALDDPFLADALEGYVYTTTAADDLEKMKARLNKKREKKKTIPFFKTYRWLNAAAIIIILAGAGWFAYSNFKNQKTSLADKAPVQEEKKAEPINSPSNKTADTSIANQVVPIDKTLQINKPSQQQQTIESSKKTFSKKTEEEITATKIAENKNNSVAQNPEISLSKPTEPATAFKASAASKPITDSTNNAVTKNQMASDIKGRGVTTADTIKNFNVTLQSRQPQLDEVVVVGKGVHKNAVPRYPRVIIDTLEPTEGYDEFDDYIADNLKMPDEIKTKTVSGEIQLSFDVDEEGKPTNIAVVKSLCNKCDEEAVRLLKEGPKWKKKKNKKGKLTIRF